MILVDSSVWIDYFNGQENRESLLLDRLLLQHTIITGDIILLEILQGFSNDRDFLLARNELSKLPCYDLSNKDLALKGAQYYRTLRKKGITIRKTIDMVIGTFCIENDVMLLHRDKDFLPMSEHLGLKSF